MNHFAFTQTPRRITFNQTNVFERYRCVESQGNRVIDSPMPTDRTEPTMKHPKPVTLQRAIKNARLMGSKPKETPAEKLLDRAYQLLARKK